MADRLDGTVALITGASSGIGAATALELAGLGASVSLVARRSDRLEDVATTIRGQGGRALVLKADITDEPQAREVVERTAAELGRLDTLVNNAGVMLLGPVEDAPLSEWQRMININLLGLVVTLNQVTLNITAVPGAGNLLGNLLCAVVGLLNGGGLGGLTSIAALLNEILAALGL